MSFLSRIKRIPYIRVSECPYCGSKMTGHLMKAHRDSVNEYVELEALRTGEIVRVVAEVPSNNCFCLECGTTWQEELHTEFISKDEMIAEKNDRHTVELLNAYSKELAEKERQTNVAIRQIRKWTGKI